MNKSSIINKIIKIHINVNEYTKICYFYIKNNNFEYNLIFSRSWLNRNNVQIVIKKKQFILILQIYISKAQKINQKRLS